MAVIKKYIYKVSEEAPLHSDFNFDGKVEIKELQMSSDCKEEVCNIVFWNPSVVTSKGISYTDDFVSVFRAGLNHPEKEEHNPTMSKRPGKKDLIIWSNNGDRKVWSKSTNRVLFNYLDSSIWHYFHDKDAGNNDAIGCPNIEIIGKEISYRAKGLNGGNVCRYDLAVAEEYRDFNQRKWENSYIEGKGGHSKGVLPFVHHSEYAMWKYLEKALSESGSMLGGGYEWRILLVDDHAVEGMHIGGEKKTDSGKNGTDFGKIDIIKDDLLWLNQGYGASRSAEAPTWYSDQKIKIECVDSKDKALNKLKDGNRYDVILLDYKLDIAKNECVFGTEILSELEKSIGTEKEQYYPCPAGEYNFMFISAYPTAVQEDMLSRGLYTETDNWFVRRGACPTNTPWLFLFELHRIMQRRLDKLTTHLEMIKKSEDKPLQPTALSFINWLFADPTLVRDRCKNSFNAFLTLRSTYDQIKYDVYDGKEHKDDDGRKDHKFVDDEKKESRLIRSMFPDVVCYSNTFWEHMQHLVYLTAYGTNRQWSEMWEELMCVEKRLNEAEKTIKDADKTTSGLPQDTVKQIRTYIIGLKNGKY